MVPTIVFIIIEFQRFESKFWKTVSYMACCRKEQLEKREDGKSEMILEKIKLESSLFRLSNFSFYPNSVGIEPG